MLVIPQYPR